MHIIRTMPFIVTSTCQTIFTIVDSKFYYYFMRYDDIVAKCCGYYVKSEYAGTNLRKSCFLSHFHYIINTTIREMCMTEQCSPTPILIFVYEINLILLRCFYASTLFDSEISISFKSIPYTKKNAFICLLCHLSAFQLGHS